MFITRRNVDGSLDTTFGNGGLVMIDFAQSGFDSGQAVIILPDGKILVGGSSGADFALVRLNNDGTNQDWTRAALLFLTGRRADGAAGFFWLADFSRFAEPSSFRCSSDWSRPWIPA